MSVRLNKKQKIANVFLRPAMIAGSSYLASKFIDDNGGQNVKLFNMEMSMPMAYAAIGAVSSLITTPITEFVMNKIRDKYVNLSQNMVNLLVHAVLNVVAIYALTDPHILHTPAALVAVIAEITTQYIDPMLVPML